MIKLSNLCLHTRLAAGDTAKNQYDDFEVNSAVDSAVNMLSEACIENFSDLLVRSAVVELNDGEGVLPEDFLAIADVGDKAPFSQVTNGGNVPSGGYALRGEFIYCGGDNVYITYHRRPRINDDGIDLPFNLLLPLAELAAVILQNEEGKKEVSAEMARTMALASKRRSMGAVPDPAMWRA